MAATRTHLDSLTPGMRARLDPSFRIPKKPAYVFNVNGEEAEAKQPGALSQPVTRFSPVLSNRKITRF